MSGTQMDIEHRPAETLPAEREAPAPIAAEGDLTGLMRLALERGEVESLEKLVALKERVDERNARAAFFEAVSSVQAAVTEVPKTKTAKIATRKGGSYSYSYAPLEAITRTIRPVLRKHGLSYSFTTEPGGADGVLNVVCILRHVEGHEERATFPVPVDTKAAMSAAQANGAALTYGRRQSLVAVLGLTAADDDVDGADVGRASTETITEKQAADIDALIDEVGANKAKFLEWLEVESVSDIPASDHKRAVRALERKREAAS